MQFKPELQRVSDRYKQILTNHKKLDPALIQELLNALEQPLAEHQIALLIDDAKKHFEHENKPSPSFRGPHLFKSSTGHELIGIDASIQRTLDDVHIQYLQGEIAAKCFNLSTSHEADRETSFVHVIGDDQLFSASGTEYARSGLKSLLTEQFPESVILYSFVGNSDPNLKTGDTNHLINELIASKEIHGNRVLANTINGYTQRAMRDAPHLSIAKEVKWFTLVYQYDSKSGKVVDCNEREDTPLLSRLANQAVICCEGDIRCFQYLIHMLYKNVRVIGFTGLREQELATESATFSAAGFLEFMNDTVTNLKSKGGNIDSAELQDLLQSHARSIVFIDNAEKSQQLLNACIKDIIHYHVWDKMHLVEINMMPRSPKSKAVISQHLEYLALSGSPIVRSPQITTPSSTPEIPSTPEGLHP